MLSSFRLWFTFSLASPQDGDILQTFLKLLREVQIFRVPTLMGLLESRYKGLIQFFDIIRPVHLLLFVWNTTACVWIWINESVLIRMRTPLT